MHLCARTSQWVTCEGALDVGGNECGRGALPDEAPVGRIGLRAEHGAVPMADQRIRQIGLQCLAECLLVSQNDVCHCSIHHYHQLHPSHNARTLEVYFIVNIFSLFKVL